MEHLKVSQVAKILGITPTAVYKKFKTSSELVQNHVHKEKGVTFIDTEGVEILKAAMQKGAPEVEDPCRNEPVQNLVETLQKELDRKQTVIESLIAQQETQRQRTDTILMKLTSDISTLQKALEYRMPEPTTKPVEKESRMPSVSQDRRADPRQVFSFPAVKSGPIQREVSAWESIKTSFDDVLGFAFGRG